MLVIEHQESCPPAAVGRWLEEGGLALEVVRPYLGDVLPARIETEALLVLGGSMGATEDDRAPWLPAVRALIVDGAARGLPVLGICLGHQLAAAALGGITGRNPQGQTVGLRRIEERLVDDELAGTLAPGSPVIQWNDDCVLEAPPGSTALATNDRGDLLMARFAPTVWGIQGHPEADADMVGVWAAKDIAEGGLSGATPAEVPALLAQIEEHLGPLADAWAPVIRAWAGLVHAGAGDE